MKLYDNFGVFSPRFLYRLSTIEIYNKYFTSYTCSYSCICLLCKGVLNGEFQKNKHKSQIQLINQFYFRPNWRFLTQKSVSETKIPFLSQFLCFTQKSFLTKKILIFDTKFLSWYKNHFSRKNKLKNSISNTKIYFWNKNTISDTKNQFVAQKLNFWHNNFIFLTQKSIDGGKINVWHKNFVILWKFLRLINFKTFLTYIFLYRSFSDYLFAYY